MKRKKYNQRGVWACATCWFEIEWVNGKNYKLTATECPKCNNKVGYGVKPLFFDSQAEYTYARKLKEMESKGLISELIHHPRIELIPAIYVRMRKENMVPLIFETCQHKESPNNPLLYKKEFYEADFQYTDSAGIHLVEVKKLGLKGPFIPNLPAFRRKVELLKVVHGIDLEIMTGAIRWRFEGKKLIRREI